MILQEFILISMQKRFNSLFFSSVVGFYTRNRRRQRRWLCGLVVQLLLLGQKHTEQEYAQQKKNNKVGVDGVSLVQVVVGLVKIPV